ncbi:MAG: metallophosphoesterase [Akkermansia sp.]|nr:metallophosphoesterase [Akkermansia sp.]
MRTPLFIRRLTDHVIRNKYCYVSLALAILLCKCTAEITGNLWANSLECNTTILPAEALPGAGPLRLALITDLHNNPEQFNKVVEQLQKAKPNFIFFGGDLVTADERFKRTRWAVSNFRKLAQIAPTFAILGNHDYEKQEQVERIFTTAGVTLLRNQAVDQKTPSGGILRIVGLGDWNEGDEAPERCMSSTGQSPAPVLVLSHDPESRWLLREYDWHLMLSGHNHGGQLGIPFAGRYLSLRSSMPAGLFDFEGGRRVLVSRGVGSIWDMRFFCTPEINIIELQQPSPAQP